MSDDQLALDLDAFEDFNDLDPGDDLVDLAPGRRVEDVPVRGGLL